MIPMRLGGVDNRHKDGKFVDALQDEITVLRREVMRLREIIRGYQSDALIVEATR
jgi:hypothetical protein